MTPSTSSHMRREIAEIPVRVRQLLADPDGALAQAGTWLRGIDPAMILTIARGSSDHAASYLKYAVELTTGIPVASLGPSIVSIYQARLQAPRAVCLAISQSGQSPQHRRPRARRAGGWCCDPGAHECRHIAPWCGRRPGHRLPGRSGTERGGEQKFCLRHCRRPGAPGRIGARTRPLPPPSPRCRITWSGLYPATGRPCPALLDAGGLVSSSSGAVRATRLPRRWR